MLTDKDRNHAIKKKRIWDFFDWGYTGKGIGYFKNHRSLTCGCAMCKLDQAYKKWTNKKSRLKIKQELKDIDPEFVDIVNDNFDDLI